MGNIGSGLYSLLKRKGKLIEKRTGVQLEIVKIADKRTSFGFPVPKRLLTKNVQSVLCDPEIDVIVELFGGVRPAANYVLRALREGKDVVTANKALLAECGEAMFRAAERAGRNLLFEASVGGGIPIIQAFREGLVANQVHSILSIINGTCNYILSRMSERQMDFSEALREAQAKGYAEANPRLDIDGIDAAHKVTILASLAFGKIARFEDVNVEGISDIRREDIQFAEEFGYRIKLLAIVKKTAGGIEARVQPTLVPKGHVLANVNGAYNAILVKSDEAEDLLFYGRGAGARPTAGAVVSDLVALAEARESGRPLLPAFDKGRLPVKKISTILSRYYLRFNVVDRPGVLAQIARVLGDHRISISDVIQKEWRSGSVVPLILLTHDACEEALRRAVRAIDRLSVVRGKSQVLRMEEA